MKEDYSGLYYIISLLLSIGLHYFFISKINIHSTLQTAITMIIAVLIAGFISILAEKKIKK